MRVSYIERSPGVWRLRIETGRSAPSEQHPTGERQFSYETVKGTEEDAQRRRFDILRSHEEGSFAKPEKLTVSGFLGRPIADPKAHSYWVAQRLALGKIGRSTADNYQMVFDCYLIPALGGKRLQKVEAHDVQALYTRLLTAGELSRSSVCHVHRVVSAAFKSARKSRLIVVNPMEEVEAPKSVRPKPKALEQADMVKVIDACEGNWKWPIAVIGFGAGLRRGEVLGLRRKDVDLAGARLHVRGQLVQYQDGTTEWKEPKTETGVRTVSLSPELVDVLRDVLREGLEARMRGGVGSGGLDDAPVFSFDGCAFIAPAKLSKSFGRLCDTIGLPEFTFHGTRHTHGTALLKKVGKAGAKAVSQRLGHSDIVVTLSVYQTVFEEDDRELADLMPSVTGRKRK